MEPVSQQRAFPRSARLLKPSQYKQVFSSPVKFFQPGLMVFCRANDKGYPRLGLAISKKSLPRAVDRNKVKRLVRETFRNHQNQNISVDIVVLSRNPMINMDNTQILKQLGWIWRKINTRDW